MRGMHGLLSAIGLLSFCGSAHATILPPNDLHLEDDINSRNANITEQAFNEIIDEVVAIYEPIVTAHGGKLVAVKNWKNSTVNAMADRSGKNWRIHMWGGLARRAEVTPDGFAMVVCHELGHHLGGFPIRKMLFSAWAANEGQSDYWAAQACARKLWESSDNRLFADSVDSIAKASCDKAWAGDADRFLCYRTVTAAHSTTTLLGALNKKKVSFAAQDTKKVGSTMHSHPQAQCRLDTYLAGAVCEMDFNEAVIPKSEDEQRRESCFTADGHAMGSRPLCWFAPKK